MNKGILCLLAVATSGCAEIKQRMEEQEKLENEYKNIVAEYKKMQAELASYDNQPIGRKYFIRKFNSNGAAENLGED